MGKLDDIKTYRDVADAAYANKAKSILNPKAVNAQREIEADGVPTPAAVAAPVVPSAPKFTKGFSPEERASQAAKLKAKLKETGDV